MNQYETQKEEIETIKPRTFEVKLSNADVIRLYEKAFSNGITPEELIADYLGDLLDGTYTRGSDERLFASQYFDRCCYEFNPKSLIQWALYEYRAEDLKEALESLEDANGDLQLLEEEKEAGEIDPQEYESAASSLQDYKADAETEIQDIYKEYLQYKERAKEEPQELEEGLAELRTYYEELENMIERGVKN